MSLPKLRNFTTSEINILAKIDGVKITETEMTKDLLICNPTDLGFLIESPEGLFIAETLDNIHNFFMQGVAS